MLLARPAERDREFDTDLALGGDADRLVAEAFAGLAVSGQEPAGCLPLSPPPLGRLACCGKVVPLLDQPTTAPHHGDLPDFPFGADLLVPAFEDRQAARLLEPLVLGAVAARLAPAALLSNRQRQPVPDRADTGIQRDKVLMLGATGQAPLVMRVGGDRTGPP